MKYTKQLFEKFDHEFLLKLTPPDWWKKDSYSLQWFTQQEGQDFLRRRYNAYNFSIDTTEIKEYSEDVEDVGRTVTNKKKTIRNFLS